MKSTFLYKNASIHYHDDGKGKTVVLLHGFLEDSSVWKLYKKQLQEKFRVICIDLPGHGDSDCLGYHQSMELMADCVFNLLRSLKIRKPQIVGHSMGGYIGLAYLEKYPDNCRSLVLFNSTAKDDSAERKVNRERAIKIIQTNYNLFIEQAIPALFIPDKPFKTAISQVKKMAKKAKKQGVIACIQGMKIRSNREIIIKFSPCPVLFIGGKKDPIIPYSTLIEQALSSDFVECHISDFGGHMCFYEDSDNCYNALLQFLSRH